VIGVSCKKKVEAVEDTPTSGSVSIAADATLQPVIQAQINAFERIYDQAHVSCQYGAEAEIFQTLLKDSVPAIVAARELTRQEQAHFDAKDIVPRYTPIGADAIVLLVNRNNPDSLLKFAELQAIFQGELSTWNALDAKNKAEKIAIVFDNEGSSTVTTIIRLFDLQKLPPNAYAQQTNSEVLAYVAKNRSAIGVVGMSWISDLTDSERAQLERQMTIVYLQPKDYKGERYFKPDQVNISEGNYPLFRRLQIINCEGKAGLVSGFATYVASPKGQLLMLKSGILSATLPERVVRSN